MVLVRADANEIIGTGHVMRCMSIARAFIEKGEKVLFVTADHRGDSLISQHGFDTVCLESDWTDMDNEKIVQVINEYKPDLLLLDSYYITENYVNKVKKNVKVAYIDDLNRNHWQVDYLINYNIFAKVMDYSSYDCTKTKLLLNPKFAPLRDEFKNCPKHMMKSVSEIIVSAGGADPEHITEKILSGICSEFEMINFHFIVGALNPRLDDIKSLAEGRINVILHINEQHMSDLMKNCDIAISAAGTTLYEVCATGIPTITYTLADNQLVAAEQFDKQGIMLSAGDCRDNNEFLKRIEILLKKLVEDIELRKRLSAKMQCLVDGEGANRIAEALLRI